MKNTGCQWFAVHVRIRYEKFVADLLEEKGFETVLPLYRHKRQHGRFVKESALPLFPGYTFCRLDPANRLPILITPGVIRLLGTGNIPQPIEETEVLSIKRAAEASVDMKPYPYWRFGQTGRIVKGPLAGLEGPVTHYKGALRLVLSITLLQRSVLVEVDPENVIIVGSQPLSPATLR